MSLILRHILTATLILAVHLPVYGQHSSVVLHGRVTSSGHGVPYATLQLQGTSIGVSCNDEGHYELKVPEGHESDTVVVRSMGYYQAKYTVALLAKHGNIKLKVCNVELSEVQVRGYRSGRYLLQEAIDRIGENYRQQTAWSTFFYRDWRAVDNQLYVFDEAVMSVERAGYNRYADKKIYRFDHEKREMNSNYKTMLRHRLLIYDIELLTDILENPDGVDEMMMYADNQDFFDPVSTPQASYMLAKRILGMHFFDPIQEFTDDGVGYYQVSSEGPCRTPGAKVRYVFSIRKSDMAIVSITSSERHVRNLTMLESWINSCYNKLEVEIDTSAWLYDQRDGKYTLTRYYNFKSVRLDATMGRHAGKQQRWLQSIDWVLTDYTLTPPDVTGESVQARTQLLSNAFGGSDYSTDFWGQYNSILLDALPARLLYEKLNTSKK